MSMPKTVFGRVSSLSVVVVLAGAAACGPEAATYGDAGQDLRAASCAVQRACDSPAPAVESGEWAQSVGSEFASVGDPAHRMRDQVVQVGDAQEFEAKFAYGAFDKDLEEEDIEVFLLRGCGDTWEPLGTYRTNGKGRVKVVFGREVERLGVGRHRLHMVVKGDGSSVDGFIQVLDGSAPAFVSDVDGTLTTSELADLGNILTGDQPDLHPGVPEVLGRLAAVGYLPVYMSARPESYTERMRELIRLRGLPPGIVVTYPSAVPQPSKDAAAEYKENTIRTLQAAGLAFDWGFGNNRVESAAYEATEIPSRVFYQFTDANGGQRIEDYRELLPEVNALKRVCE